MFTLKALTLTAFRGVPNLTIQLDGGSAAIVGPNGSGKSSIVDAFDFLVTGEIRWLRGQGAGDLSLSKHGPHIDHDLSEAAVTGIFHILESNTNVSVTRRLKSPDKLETSDVVPPSLLKFMHLAQHAHHHLLTRREILQYILAEPSKRGDQVAALLQLSQVDAFRKELQVATKAARDDRDSRRAVYKARLQTVLNSFSPLSCPEFGGR